MTSKYLVSATGGMELPFNKRGKTRKAKDFGEKKSKFDFGHLKFEMPMRCLRKLDV